MSDQVAIVHFRRLDARLTTLPDEGQSVTALGMAYSHIPVDFDAPTEADYRRFVNVMAAVGDDPVHVHCIVNARVTAFVYRWRRDTGGVDDARAMLDSVWRPGGVWAAFIGDDAATDRPHAYAGRDY